MRRTAAAIFIGVGVLLLTAALVIGTGGAEGIALFNPSSEESSRNTPSEDGRTVPPEKGSVAPDFSLESLSGDRLRLSDFQGKVVLLNFWAVWCPPCRQEMPAFQYVHENYGDELVILGVNAGDSREDAAAFAEEFGLTFDIILDSESKVESQYRVRGLPTTYLIDPDGVIQILHIGYLEDSQLMGYLTDMGIN